MSLRILHTVSNNQWGGLERRVFNECAWMAGKGHDISIVTPDNTPLFDKSSAMGWQVHTMPFTSLNAPFDYFHLRTILKTFRPDILNTHGNMDGKVGLVAAKGLNIPHVILSRHITPDVKNNWYNRQLYRNLCTHIFTTADCTGTQIINDLNVAPEKVFTISSGIIPPEEMLPKKEARLLLSQRFKRNSGTRYIGYIGRLTEDKGIFDLIRAFDRIREKFTGHCLVLVGDGGEKEDIENFIKAGRLESRVILAGYTDNPWEYYRAFDANVLASTENEGIPQALLEAMFAQCPVIGTQVGGIPDVIRDKETGLLVLPKNPDSLAGALETTLEDQSRTGIRARAAFEFVSRSHTIDAMGRKILSILDPG